MKVFSFLKWKIKQATIGDWLWGAGCALIGAGIFDYEANGKYLIIAGVAMWILIVFFEIIIKGIKRDYRQFVNEQNELFNTIKNSDQK